MRTTLLSLVALAVICLSVSSANSQFRVHRGYNPFTGRVHTQSYARNPYTGQVGARRTTYNPWTGRTQTNTVYRNPWTGLTTRSTAGVNPLTGRVGAYTSVRRW
jgi:hypothetical protein